MDTSNAAHPIDPRTLHDSLRRVAGRVRKRYQDSDIDDLHQSALLIACEHAHRYDPSRGASFLTFIAIRARGHLLNMCDIERRDLERRRALERQCALDRREHHVEDGDDDEPDHDGHDDADQRARRRHEDARAAATAKLLFPLFQVPSSPEEILANAEERERQQALVQTALAELDPVDRSLVILVAIDGMPMAKAARQVGLEYDRARYRCRVALAGLGKRLAGLTR